jgi:pimeloyl-CoA synthetase
MNWFNKWWRKLIYNSVDELLKKAVLTEEDVREFLDKIGNEVQEKIDNTDVLSVLSVIFTQGLESSETALIQKAAQESGILAPVVVQGLTELVEKGNGELAEKLDPEDYDALLKKGGKEMLVAFAMRRSNEVKAAVRNAVARLMDIEQA